jgi:hypothetical protein
VPLAGPARITGRGLSLPDSVNSGPVHQHPKLSVDILVAASALANNWTLVTHNKEGFERIDGLKIEDWY